MVVVAKMRDASISIGSAADCFVLFCFCRRVAEVGKNGLGLNLILAQGREIISYGLVLI
jgi:hypothetical protein